MADKQAVLSIVLRAVDQATGGIRAFAKRLDEITKPTRELGKVFSELADKSGFNDVVDGFKGVGGAVKDLLGKLLMIGGVVGVAVGALLHLIDKFDQLGDLAERLGVNVDFLAAMRYAAEKAGAPVGALDSGLQTFVENLGQARAGVGRMTKFLEQVSPPLLQQLKATKSNEAAFRLLADAMAKVHDPAKRLALAQKTVGDAALAPLLALGSKGLLELQGSYAGLAGSQEEAAEGAGKVDDAMHDLKAAADGIEAALVSGLSPALQQIVEELQAWFSENRERIGEWAADLGKKLPGAIHRFADAFLNTLDKVQGFIDSIGGLKTVAIGLAAVLVGPLVASIFTLSAALLTTPVGWIVTGIGLIAAGAYELIKHWDAVSAFFGALWDAVKSAFTVAFQFVWDYWLKFTPLGLIIDHWEPIKDFFAALWDGITSAFSRAWDFIKPIVDKIAGAVDTVTGAVRSVGDFLAPSRGPFEFVQRAISTDTLNAAAGPGAAARSSEARVKVDFSNAPRGTRVTTDPQSSADVDLSVGYQMGFAP